MNDAPIDRARELADRLKEQGHHAAASRLHEAAGGSHLGQGLFHALREACQFVLTAIEALDPKTEAMAEELRLEVDKRLEP